MTSKACNFAKNLIINILENSTFCSLNKPRKDFMISVLWHILSIKGKINFLQLERFSSYSEQTFRNNYEETFDFMKFNTLMIEEVCSTERVIAFDPSYIPKAGKKTYGCSYFWSGVAKSAKWGLDIGGFAVVDVPKNTAFHLNAWQTPSADKIKEEGFNLLSYYGNLITENAEEFKKIAFFLVCDAYFSKKPFVDVVGISGMHLISRLRAIIS